MFLSTRGSLIQTPATTVPSTLGPWYSRSVCLLHLQRLLSPEFTSPWPNTYDLQNARQKCFWCLSQRTLVLESVTSLDVPRLGQQDWQAPEADSPEAVARQMHEPESGLQFIKGNL